MLWHSLVLWCGVACWFVRIYFGMYCVWAVLWYGMVFCVSKGFCDVVVGLFVVVVCWFVVKHLVVCCRLWFRLCGRFGFMCSVFGM